MKIAKKVAALAVATVAAFAVTMLGGTAANAATPQVAATSVTETEDNCLTPQTAEPTGPASLQKLSFNHHRATKPCRQVEVVENCDETATVTVKNTGDEDALKVKFRVNGKWSNWLGGGESQTFTISAEDSDEILVQSLFFGKDYGLVTLVDESWNWSAACLEASAVSTCDDHFKVTVKNTSTADGEFTWALGLSDSETVKIKAGDSQSEVFLKGQVVQIRVGKDELFKSFEWTQPEGCTTPTPSASPTTAPPTTTGPPAAPLPVTGADASSAFLYGGVGVAGGVLMLIGAGIYWLRRRRDQETVA